jgi:hypothetical protein
MYVVTYSIVEFVITHDAAIAINCAENVLHGITSYLR